MSDQEHIRVLMRGAADSALSEQMGHLYKVYLSGNGSGGKQRPATAKGIERAIEAYRLLQDSIGAWQG